VAEDVTRIPALSAGEPAQVVAPQPPRPVAPHRARFLAIYGGLGAALAAAIAGVVVFAGGAINPSPKWSAWKPSGGGEGAAKQIAAHVGTTYRLANGEQLVDVIATTPSISQPTGGPLTLHYVALTGIRGAPDRIDALSPSNSMMYSLCGLGAACSIASGKPSLARGTLVRREILELALYTFKYVGGIKHVIAFIPPVAKKPVAVVYLQKSDLTALLKVPLRDTLGARVPLPSTIPAREVHTIDATTERRAYTVVRVTQTPTGDPVLVLTRLTA
jgi:hypothetical protein